jgi:hypothetical protein
MNLLIRISGDDPTDIEFIRTRAVGAVEEVVEEVEEEGRFDGDVEVSWDIDDAD